MSARGTRAAPTPAYARTSRAGAGRHGGGLPHWMSAVAAGEPDFASMLAMTSEEAEAKRRRGADRKVRAAGFRSSRPWPTSTSPSALHTQGRRGRPGHAQVPGGGRERGAGRQPGVGQDPHRGGAGGGGGARPQGALHRLRGPGAT